MRFVVFVLVLWALTVSQGLSGEKKDEVLAEVGPWRLTKADFEAKIQAAPPQIRMILSQQPQLKKMIVDRWVEISLLSLAARDAGLDRDPAIKLKIEEATNQILAQAYLEKEVLRQAPPVTEEEVAKFYQEHRDRFREPEAVRARHILIEVPQGASEEQEARARKKAEELRQRAVKGEDFGELARRYSADPGSRQKGGELGFFTRGQMVREFEEAAFALKPGEVSQPVRTAFGYHLIQVEERRPARQKSLEEVRGQIQQELTRQRQEELLSRALAELKKKYPTKVYPDRL